MRPLRSTAVTGRIGRVLGRRSADSPSPLATPGAAPAPCLGCRDKVGRPTPIEPIPGRTATPTDVVVPPPDSLLGVVDGHLVVLDAAAGRAVLLNASAALVLTAFDGERPVADVVAQLVDETGMDEALIAADVRATVDRLLALGIVTLTRDQAEGGPDAAATVAARPTRDPDRWASTVDRLLAEVRWAWDRGPFRLAATSVRVRVDDPEVAAHLDHLLGSLTDQGPGKGAPHTMSIVSRRVGVDTGSSDSRRGYRVVVDGRVVARVATPDAAAVHALHHLDELAVEGSAGALLFHAGAVERDGRVVVVLGVSGKGKSTLTAALVQHGFRYLSDEVVAVDMGTGEVWPYPKALDLHPGSLDLLGLDPVSASLQLPGSKGKLLPERLGDVGSGGRPALLVFLAETLAPPAGPGAAPVEVVPPAEALVALLPVTFEHTIEEPGHFQALASLCEATPAIRIGRAPLDAVVAEVEAALAASP